ncbi:hypothetical protein HYH03_006803 [Edaphochlamys debaryana]|uniref:Uncharacterized protein n=1 Tax=Edaphochlamys debaryana TaxID=47281 RepID=A0A835Y284_9CHLO|nr:hypothetical protein HYH03_006803 [Edaphochlamys debaryana]|eukprot:KAG2495197.1 hypothetical protein HYH03_006803 [Edaphochlamys debaryana]
MPPPAAHTFLHTPLRRGPRRRGASASLPLTFALALTLPALVSLAAAAAAAAPDETGAAALAAAVASAAAGLGHSTSWRLASTEAAQHDTDPATDASAFAVAAGDGGDAEPFPALRRLQQFLLDNGGGGGGGGTQAVDDGSGDGGGGLGSVTALASRNPLYANMLQQEAGQYLLQQSGPDNSLGIDVPLDPSGRPAAAVAAAASGRQGAGGGTTRASGTNVGAPASVGTGYGPGSGSGGAGNPAASAPAPAAGGGGGSPDASANVALLALIESNSLTASLLSPAGRAALQQQSTGTGAGPAGPAGPGQQRPGSGGQPASGGAQAVGTQQPGQGLGQAQGQGQGRGQLLPGIVAGAAGSSRNGTWLSRLEGLWHQGWQQGTPSPATGGSEVGAGAGGGGGGAPAKGGAGSAASAAGQALTPGDGEALLAGVKGVGLQLDPASLQNLTSRDVLYGLYNLYNSAGGSTGSGTAGGVSGGGGGPSAGGGRSVGIGGGGGSGSSGGGSSGGGGGSSGLLEAFRSAMAANSGNGDATADDDYTSDLYGSTALGQPQSSYGESGSGGSSAAGGAATQPSTRNPLLGRLGGGQLGASGRGSTAVGGGSARSASGGGGGGGAANGGGSGAGGGGTGFGNLTRANELFPFCQPPSLLCADRDILSAQGLPLPHPGSSSSLVTFLGVSTDQVVYTPTVLQYAGIGAISQNGLTATTRSDFFDGTSTSALTATDGLRFSTNLLFNSLNGVASSALQLLGAVIDEGPRGRLLPKSVALTAGSNTNRAIFDRVSYKPNWVLTGTGPGFAVTAVNFGPYGNFLIPGGLASTFSPGVPDAGGGGGGDR